MARLWTRYQASVLDRVGVLEDAGVALATGTLAPELAGAAQGEAHKLAGSMGTFGMPAGTALARRAETLLRAGAQPADASELLDLATGLRAVIVAGVRSDES